MSHPDDALTPAFSGSHQWAAAPVDRDLSGKTLGDFEVERLLGRGGMGEVYLARQTSLNRPVALKVLRPDLLSKSNYLSRFEAEAAAVARLNHPNIVHVYTLGSVDGVRFIAMEYVQGSNLREYIRKKGAVDYPLALSIMRQAAVAVGAAGEVGLIHRDIKPENLLLTRKGQVKIADFGLCRDLDSAQLSLTQSGVTMGTPLYMSPEQAQGHAIDHRSDLYSLGVTFYHMLAGVPPFRAETPLAMALKHVKDRPASIAVHRPDVPPELDRLVLKLMAKSAADRYQSAAEMLRDLARVREAMNAPSGAQPVADVSNTAIPAEPAASPSSSKPSKRTEIDDAPVTEGDGSRWLGLGPKTKAGLIALGLSLGALVGWLGRSEDLLASTAPEPQTMPGLWLAPEWPNVPKLASAEDQYRDAQVRAPRDGIDAAWLAVPGHYPNSREWSARAYTQLARLYLRRHDSARLAALAADVDQWPSAQTHEKWLAHIARAGVAALNDDLDGVLKALGKQEFDAAKITDPALLELCLEVTTQAERVAALPGGTTSLSLARPEIRGIQLEMVRKLFQAAETRPLGPAIPGRVDPADRPRGKSANRPSDRP